MSEPSGIAVLGSTGTIGTNTLRLVSQFPEKFRVLALAAGRNEALLREQIQAFSPRVVSLQNADALPQLRRDFPEVKFFAGEEGLAACIEERGVATVVMGIVGFAALSPTLSAIRQRKRIALANKEALVVGGTLLRAEMLKSGAEVIPVDSEHNALFQLLKATSNTAEIETLVLTASGGPLLRRPELPLDQVTPEIAVAHPNWKMGPKISVDSATMMNKGLELIEAHYLFDFAPSRIEVWVHPQSIVHGAVWLRDASCLAQLSVPDMRSSIGYALAYPERLHRPIRKLTFKDFAALEFYEPNEERFPALRLARQALEAGPRHVIALNAANEIAVQAFLERKISFAQITVLAEEALSRQTAGGVASIDEIFSCDADVRARHAYL